MSLLTKPEDLKGNVTFKGMIYGQPGIGKTTLALSSPTPVLIDADNGLYRVEPHLRVPSLQVSNYEQILELIKSEEIKPFETIVIDTAGKVVDSLEKWIAKNNPKLSKTTGGLTQQGYGMRKTMFAELIKQINSMGKNVIFVAHESEEKDNDTTKIRPKLTGGPLADILENLDFIGYMEAHSNKRTISFAPTDRFYAKNSLKLNDVIIIPDTENGNTFISEKIVKTNKERLEQQALLRTQYNEVIKQAQSIILNNADLNNAVEALKTLETIWDSKYQIRAFLSNYAKENGYTYNKETKLYEKADEPSTSDETFEQMKAESKADKTPKAKQAEK